MGGSAAVGAGILALDVRGEEPAGRRGATSRRRALALALVFAAGASAAGAGLGLIAQPGPEGRQVEQLAFTTAAAVDVARRAEARAQAAEKALKASKQTVEALSAMGAAQELADYNEAERLGVARFMKDSTALWGGERRRVMSAIVREARRNGLDPLLVAAVIQVESRFDPYAVSGVGACGLMQLMPPTAQWLLDKDADSSGDPKLKASHLFNPVLNIELGTQYLAQLMSRFDGDLTTALIAYNAGPGVAHQLVRGSKSWNKLAVYPKAVLTAYKSLLSPPETLASR